MLITVNKITPSLVTTRLKSGSGNETDAVSSCGKQDDRKLTDKLSESRKEDIKEENNPYAPFPDDKNPLTGEIGGPRGPEPTRYGDWERKGRVIDF